MGSRSGSDSGGGGGNDMQVSGMEAALSNEKGISTAADTRVSNTSFSRGNDEIRGNNEIDYADSQGNIVTTTIGYGEGQVDPKLAEARLGADTSTVGSVENGRIVTDTSGNQKFVSGAFTPEEIEKGYTEYGEPLANVAGTYMTKGQLYSTGIIAKDPKTGEDIMGNKIVDPETGEIVDNPLDASFIENFRKTQKLPISLIPTKYRLGLAGAMSLKDYYSKKNFMGFNEAGQRGLLGNSALGYGQGRNSYNPPSNFNTGDPNRDAMNRIAPDAPYIMNPDLTRPDSVAQEYFNNMNMTQGSPLSSELQTDYNNAKTKVDSILGITPTSQQFGYSAQPYGLLSSTNMAANPFNIDYLKKRGLI